ncbi:MAG: DUF4935 domain-containing protein [Planctomycetes bacterium]|nr:DUF4935 domain-containing protein [Planctomycetota bacterium]
MARTAKKYLMFIDTNVLLDFYRARNDSQWSFLETLDEHRERVITTDQVEMEFKKNRQGVILEALRGLTNPDDPEFPVFLRHAKAATSIRPSRDRMREQITRLRQRIQNVLENPTTNDEVYKPIQRLFREPTEFNLTRDKPERYTIRRQAWKRFVLGYPPRKKGDTSTGDAVNWEWILACAKREKSNVVIVSLDSDYGVNPTKQRFSHLNDWLAHEFRDRVSKQKNARLTPYLAEAYKLMGMTVATRAKSEEKRLLTLTSRPQKSRYETILEWIRAQAAEDDPVAGLDDGSGATGGAEP